MRADKPSADPRQADDLEERVRRAAAACLEREGSVGPLQLLQQMLLLHPTHFQAWQKGNPHCAVLEPHILRHAAHARHGSTRCPRDGSAGDPACAVAVVREMTVLGRGVSPTRKRGFLLSEEDLIDRKVDEKGAAYRQTVRLDEALAEEPSSLHGQVAFPVGADVSGRCHWLNVAEPSSCHLLIAGTTGSGKSEFMKAMLAALARRLPPDAVQFVLIDPKRVTFNFTGESPYLLQSPFVRREQLDQCLRIV